MELSGLSHSLLFSLSMLSERPLRCRHKKKASSALLAGGQQRRTGFFLVAAPQGTLAEWEGPDGIMELRE